MPENQKQKIFIIDDDNFLLDMYALKFSQSGFEVATALGPEEALKKLREGFSPDVALMDIVMPIMNGFELLETIHKEGLAKDAIFIILSNRGQQSDIDRGNQLGAAGYIVKASTTPSEVITKVAEIVGKNKHI
jgi:two-component system alkaline phosphatase synthesis response regulator PhoP